jgi:hypothetical protein
MSEEAKPTEPTVEPTEEAKTEQPTGQDPVVVKEEESTAHFEPVVSSLAARVSARISVE